MHREKIKNLNNLKTTSKFESVGSAMSFAPNIEKESLLSLYHAVIDDFIELLNTGKQSEQECQRLIKISLRKFDAFNLDTEDREKLCGYFEDIMDAIHLESSGGEINEWLYGFKI